ncbi:AAA family ATPase [Streptomyces albiaxialis]|uniref:AAA family ATPase n=1 Tax=Streptomyces albiaxialis TaxID=329523 RepID=A0ABN2WTM3_9ACTN
MRDGLDWLVTRFAVRHNPVVAVIDDIHWADPPSLAWLTGFAPRAAELPMLFVLGYRPEDLPRDAGGFRRAVERDGTRPYELAPLSAGAVARMVRERLGDDADTAFCHECWAVTGGSPFEVTELVARSFDQGLKPQPDNLTQLRELASAVKGEGFIEALRRLGTSCVRLGWAVAVLGAEATLPLAASVAGLGREEAAHATARLREARIFRAAAAPGHEPAARALSRVPPRDGEPLEYGHPLLATAVYRAIPDNLRTALHGQAAASVTAAGLGPTVSARHLLEIHPDGDASVVEELRQAAREYLASGAPEAAHRCLGRALREPPSLEDRPRVLYELGTSALLNAPAATVNHLRAALEEPALTPGLRVQVVYRLAQALGHTDRMGEAARTLEAEARNATDTRTRLRLQAELFLRNAFRADEEDSPARSRKLARLAGHLTGRGMAERWILGLRAWDAMVRGEPTSVALHHAEEALGSGLSWTDEEWGFELPVMVALTFMYCDQPGRAEELFKAGIDECERKGWRGGHLSFGFTLLGYIRYRRGRLTDAEDLVRAGLGIADKVGNRVPAQWFAVGILIEVLIARGQLYEAQRVAEHYGFGQVTPDAVIYPDSQTVHAELLLASGLREEAEAQLTAVGRRLDPRGMRNPAWCPWQLRLADALSTTEPERAARTAWEAVERARRFGAPSAIGQALHVSALVSTGATRLERLREAVSHLERSPAAYELASALVSLGAQLRRSGLPQDAADGLYRGLEGATLCGAPALAARARDELSAAGLRPLQLREDDTDTLTTQERAAAQGLVRGLPLGRIAEELSLTEGAVRLLLSGVYRKLGTDPAGLPGLLARRLGR